MVLFCPQSRPLAHDAPNPARCSLAPRNLPRVARPFTGLVTRISLNNLRPLLSLFSEDLAIVRSDQPPRRDDFHWLSQFEGHAAQLLHQVSQNSRCNTND